MGFDEGDELPIDKYGKKQEKDGCLSNRLSLDFQIPNERPAKSPSQKQLADLHKKMLDCSLP